VRRGVEEIFDGESCEGQNDVKGRRTPFRNDVSKLAPIINFDQLMKKTFFTET
jgi:hypothetical protein